MSFFSQKLTELMNKYDISDQKLADDLGVNRTTVLRWRNGERSPKLDKLPEIAGYFSVSPCDFVENTNIQPAPYHENSKQSVQKELQRMIEGLNSGSYPVFDGQKGDELHEEDKELIIASLENSLLLVKRIAKQKFSSNLS